MNLKKILRSDFENNIRNNLIKDRCEYCGEVNNLNLHHIEKFIDIFHETMKQLDVDEKDSSEYPKDKLELIRDVMLGKQIKIKYTTSCKKCHCRLHSKDKTINENYYNDFGKYVQVDIEKLKEIKCLNESDLFKILYIFTSIDNSFHQLASKLCL